MGDDALDLPQRALAAPAVVVKPVAISKPGFTEKQMDQIIEARARAIGDMGQIVKDVVAIIRIRQQADADVRLIEADTQKIVASTRAEIDRLVQVDKNVQTRGEVAVRVIATVTELLKHIPEVDVDSRRQLIDSLRWLVEAAIDKERPQ